jgi:aryl-alcohol dehydrogenase-like predicted oxidoreductase
MEYKNLGRTGVKVSPVCLGTMNFGPHSDEATSYTIMDRALEMGVNFFDTANVYGWRTGEGVTEQIVGRWLAQGGGRRDRIVLATKVYGKMGEGPNDRRLSAYHIRRACEESLRRLQTDHLDLYQMHHVDRDTPWDEIWQAVSLLISQGKILYFGSSNLAGWQIAEAQWTANHRSLLGLASEQSVYNLTQRTVELEVIPACRFYGIGLIPYSPLAGGLLGGVLEREAQGRRASNQVQRNVEHFRKQLLDFETLCKEIGEESANVALAWLLNNPIVTAPIIGPRTVEQFDQSLHSLEIVLSDEHLVKLNEMWPGPGGEAPEAYAW